MARQDRSSEGFRLIRHLLFRRIGSGFLLLLLLAISVPLVEVFVYGANPLSGAVAFFLPFALLAILGLALNLQFGHTGLFNAGLAGFYAIGAYTAAILITADAPQTPIYPGHIGGFAMPFIVGLAAAFAIAAVVGLLVGLPTLKLRADYLAITTLALAEIFRLFLTNARTLTAGAIGITPIPRPFGQGLSGSESDALLALLLVFAVIVAFVFIAYITRTQWGRVLRSVREDEEASMVMGKDAFRFKLQSFALGCGIMGAAGAFLAIFNRVLLPTLFVPFTTFSIYVVVILGGSGNNKGVLVGAAIFYYLFWATIRIKDLAILQPVADDIAFYRFMAIGVILILVVLFRPQGVMPEEKYTPRQEA